MAANRILLADDETRLRKLVKDFLRRADYDVVEAENGKQALELFFSDSRIDLVILDVMMPEMDGFEVCRAIRQESDVPIIMLTAKGSETDQLHGFDLGVDEYVTKPFSNKILVAKVNAILRRTGAAADENMESGGIRIDKIAHQVYVGGREVELSFKEFELLCYFMENKGVALSRERILNSVWNYDYYGDARTIDTHVKKLRAKLGEYGDKIVTIRGMGYKFDPQV